MVDIRFGILKCIFHDRVRYIYTICVINVARYTRPIYFVDIACLCRLNSVSVSTVSTLLLLSVFFVCLSFLDTQPLSRLFIRFSLLFEHVYSSFIWL